MIAQIAKIAGVNSEFFLRNLDELQPLDWKPGEQNLLRTYGIPGQTCTARD